MTTIPVYFKVENKSYKEEIDINQTIEQMINNFLEQKKLKDKKYSFMVNAAALNKKKNFKKIIKHFPKIKPNCTILVRSVGNVDGGFIK